MNLEVEQKKYELNWAILCACTITREYIFEKTFKILYRDSSKWSSLMKWNCYRLEPYATFVVAIHIIDNIDMFCIFFFKFTFLSREMPS